MFFSLTVFCLTVFFFLYFYLRNLRTKPLSAFSVFSGRLFREIPYWEGWQPQADGVGCKIKNKISNIKYANNKYKNCHGESAVFLVRPDGH
jgi:hypothetical protein